MGFVPQPILRNCAPPSSNVIARIWPNGCGGAHLHPQSRHVPSSGPLQIFRTLRHCQRQLNHTLQRALKYLSHYAYRVRRPLSY